MMTFVCEDGARMLVYDMVPLHRIPSVYFYMSLVNSWSQFTRLKLQIYQCPVYSHNNGEATNPPATRPRQRLKFSTDEATCCMFSSGGTRIAATLKETVVSIPFVTAMAICTIHEKKSLCIAISLYKDFRE